MANLSTLRVPRSFHLVRVGLLCGSLLFALGSVGCKAADEPEVKTSTNPVPLWGDIPHGRPACVKGIHLTAWYAGTKKGRAKYEKLLAETELNTAVIDIKEVNGEVYIPGVQVGDFNPYVRAVSDLRDHVKYLKDRGVYTIARVVVFKDGKLPRAKPEWAVQSSSPLPKALEGGFDKKVWVDAKGNPWMDPYHPQVWKYNIDIAVKAAEMGFQEIQFDYIRFPSDGAVNRCVYSKPHSRVNAAMALAKFLERAHERLKPMGVELSIDVFGLVGSSDDGLGIGQILSKLMDHVDVICPMMYPSHYAKGEYGLAHPNAMPYETIHRSVRDTQKMMLGKNVVLRPWLQDFSLGGVKYTAQMVRDQINAANDLGVGEWLLWNPACQYTAEALLPHYKATPRPTTTPTEEPKEPKQLQ